MSPAEDGMLDDIRHARERLTAAGKPCTEKDIADELGMSVNRLHAAMRQLFSDGRRIDTESSEPPKGS